MTFPTFIFFSSFFFHYFFLFIFVLLQLLLHHVIPGAFRVNQLQDEMTGVSLAGTQLRANKYTTHDIEWNDITVMMVVDLIFFLFFPYTTAVGTR